LIQSWPITIPISFTLAEFVALTQEGTDSNKLKAIFLALATIAGAHGEIVQNNRMFWALQCFDNARVIGK
jgi:H+/gluconate symporter-like permease